MSEPETNRIPPAGPVCLESTTLRLSLPLLLDALLLVGFVCGAFGVVGSVVVLWHGWVNAFPEGRAFAVRVAVKGLVFAVVTLLSLCALRLRHRTPSDESSTLADRSSSSWRVRVALAAALLATAGLVFVNLDAYPWIAPDESHHLVVARNLAEHGLYASGHPDAGFTLFDTYDSVGAPVIMPVAAAFRLTGTSLLTARAVVGAFMLLLMVAAYLLVKPVFGAGAAVCCALMMPMTGSSIYLARSLYGEVPALCFLFLGLALWGRAIAAPREHISAVCAGVCFALAILTKTILVLSAFAFLGAWLYDALTYRRIRLRHIALPALGFLIVFAAWWCYRALAEQAAPGEIRHTLGWYQHNLLFGLTSVWKNTKTLCEEPWALLAVAAGLLIVIPVILRRRYDPPCIVVFLLAAFFLYWWFFFTPGNKPRYLWLSYAPAGLFAGVLIWFPLRLLGEPGRRPAARLACLAMLGVFAVPAVGRTVQQAELVRAFDEMSDDWALAEYAKTLPPETKMATTFYPLERTLNFLARRNVPWIENLSRPLAPYDIVVVDGRTQGNMLAGRTPVRVFGRYAVLKTRE